MQQLSVLSTLDFIRSISSSMAVFWFWACKLDRHKKIKTSDATLGDEGQGKTANTLECQPGFAISSQKIITT